MESQLPLLGAKVLSSSRKDVCEVVNGFIADGPKNPHISQLFSALQKEHLKAWQNTFFSVNLISSSEGPVIQRALYSPFPEAGSLSPPTGHTFTQGSSISYGD